MDKAVRYQFPNPNDASQDGLVCVGGNLSPQCILSAYKKGIFPWFNPGDPILWWSPNPRMVIFPSELHLSRTTKKVIRKHNFKFTFDHDFEQVILNCAGFRKNQNNPKDTWITDSMIDAYIELHQQGYAHSVECWLDNKLCGGLYGVVLGNIFFGESMFSYISESSKLALITLVKTLKSWNFKLLDCQLPSSHVKHLGAINISRIEFTKIIEQYTLPVNPENWSGYSPCELR